MAQDRTIDLTPLGGVRFEESIHRYSNIDNVTYTGITTFLHNFYEPFDAELGSINKAIKNKVIEHYGIEKFNHLKKQVYFTQLDAIKRKRNISDQEKQEKIKFLLGHHFLYTKMDSIKQKKPQLYEEIIEESNRLKIEWKEKSLASTTEGSAEHDRREVQLMEEGYWWEGKYFKYVEGKNILNVTLDDRIVIPECLVWNHEHKLSGLADIFLFDKGKLLVQDYKTNEEIKKDSFMDQRMFEPCKRLPDTSLSHYSLQLRIYQKLALMLRPEFKPGNNTLIHTASEKYERDEDVLIPCLNVNNEVDAIFSMLKNGELIFS